MIRPATTRVAAAGSGLQETQRRLHAASSVGELLARASALACDFTEFDRAVIVTPRERQLVTDGGCVIDHPACDAMRLRVLASAIPLRPDSEEAELIRRSEALERRPTPTVSPLRDALDLRCYVIAPIIPESRVVALLVVDRAEGAVETEDRESVALFAHLVGLALERTVLRTRISELASELRHMTISAQALVQEAVSAPVTVPTDFAGAPVFSPVVGPRGASPAQLTELLTSREVEILNLMADGRSNREIARELHLAPDTIKSHVTRVLRKLGASNRAEAVGRYLTMAQAGSA